MPIYILTDMDKLVSILILSIVVFAVPTTLSAGSIINLDLPHHGRENQCLLIAGCVECKTLTLEGVFWERAAFDACGAGCETNKWSEAGYGICRDTGDWKLCGIGVNSKCFCQKNVTTETCSKCEAGFLIRDGLCFRDGSYKLSNSTADSMTNNSLPFKGNGLSCDHVRGCNACCSRRINATVWEKDALGLAGRNCEDDSWPRLGYGNCRSTGVWKWYGLQYNELCFCEKSVNTGECSGCEDGLTLKNGLCWPKGGSEAVVNGEFRRCPRNSDRAVRCNGMRRLCDKRVHEIVWAGTHNAGSYNLRFIDELGNPEHVVGWCKELPWWSDVVPKRDYIMVKISENQDYDVTKQLSDGIRYLNIDVCQDIHGVLKTCHCMWGDELSLILTKVYLWLADMQNRNEVIFIAFGDGMRGRRRMQKLAHLVESILGYYLAPKSFWNRTLRELITCNHRVFVLWGCEDENALWWAVSKRLMETGSFARTSSPEVMIADQYSKLENRRYGKLHTVSWILTPDFTLLGTVLASPILGTVGVKTYANIVNRELTTALKKYPKFKTNTNVFLVDFYQIGQVLNLVKSLNARSRQ